MPDAPWSLLDDPLISVQLSTGEETALSLPAVLLALAEGTALEFRHLRRHQQHAWHAFLVQLGAIVAHRMERHDLSLSKDEWRHALHELSGDTGEAAWCLVVDDIAQPAFMQPPVPEGTLANFRHASQFPDDLDVVVTARNHEQKRQLLAAPKLDHWILALVTLQTMEGFSGRSNYEIARMKGGYGSRPGLAFAPGLTWSERFRRDIAVWLESRDGLVGESYGYASQGGYALLWTAPWDGKTSLSLQQCDPFFIEICRRVRITSSEDQLTAHYTGTETRRLAAKERQGNTGDVWTPIAADGSALTIGPGGLSYGRLTDVLLTGDFPHKPSLRVRDEDGNEPIFIGQVLARGQGTTSGYHERLLPIPRSVHRRLGDVAAVKELAELAQSRIERANSAKRRVLHPALCALLQGGATDLDLRDKRTRRWLDRLDRAIDGVFFEDLFNDADLPTDDAMKRWDERLHVLARLQLSHAMRAAPVPGARRLRAQARAELVFRRCARKQLSTLAAGAAVDEQEEVT